MTRSLTSGRQMFQGFLEALGREVDRVPGGELWDKPTTIVADVIRKNPGLGYSESEVPALATQLAGALQRPVQGLVALQSMRDEVRIRRA